jgi:hypothetical protein
MIPVVGETREEIMESAANIVVIDRYGNHIKPDLPFMPPYTSCFQESNTSLGHPGFCSIYYEEQCPFTIKQIQFHSSRWDSIKQFFSLEPERASYFITSKTTGAEISVQSGWSNKDARYVYLGNRLSDDQWELLKQYNRSLSCVPAVEEASGTAGTISIGD